MTEVHSKGFSFSGKAMRRITDAEWQERAAKVGATWLEPPSSALTKGLIKCNACGHKYLVTGSNIRQKNGCASCARQLPITAKQWHSHAAGIGSTWIEFPEKTKSKGLLKCNTCQHEWWARGSNVIYNSTGCPKCASSAPVSSEEWELRAAKVGAKWLNLPKSSNHKGLLRCDECRHEWSSLGSNIHRGSGCPNCIRVTAEEWGARAEKIGAVWLGLPKNANQKGRLLCLVCGHEWEALGQNIHRGQGCPICADHGYKLNRPGTFYLLRILDADGWEWVGYGITNVSKHRMATHRKNLSRAGCTIKETFRIERPDGKWAQDLEKKFDAMHDGSNTLKSVEGFKTESFPSDDYVFAGLKALAIKHAENALP